MCAFCASKHGVSPTPHKRVNKGGIGVNKGAGRAVRAARAARFAYLEAAHLEAAHLEAAHLAAAHLAVAHLLAAYLALLNGSRLLLVSLHRLVPHRLHLLLIILMQLAALPLKLLPQQRNVPVLLLLQTLQVIAMTQLHLLTRELQPPLIRLEFRAQTPVIILHQLQPNLRVRLRASDLVLVLV